MAVIIIMGGVIACFVGYSLNDDKINATIISATIATVAFLYSITNPVAKELDDWIKSKRFKKNQLKVRVIDGNDSKINEFLHNCKKNEHEVVSIKPYSTKNVIVEYLVPIDENK